MTGHWFSVLKVSDVALWKSVLGRFLLREHIPLRWDFVPTTDFAGTIDFDPRFLTENGAPGRYSPREILLLEVAFFGHHQREDLRVFSEAAIAAAQAAQKMGTLLSVLRKANARLGRNDALEEAAIAARAVLGNPTDEHGQELPGWGKLPHSKSVLEALADIHNQWWHASPSEVVKVFARAGLPEVAEYATGYHEGRPLRDIELTEAAQAARQCGHSHTADALE